jgi:hypothetical protein
MKKNLLLTFVLCILSVAAMSQVCIPLSSLQPGQTDPDTASGGNFVNGAVGAYYSDVYSVHVPDSQTILTFTIHIIHIKFMGTSGLPAGLSAQCNVADSIWPADSLGCVKIFGTPTSPGTFPITIQQQVLLQGYATPIPLNNNNFSITITSGAGIASNSDFGFDVFTDFNAMNADHISIGFKTNEAANVSLQIYSLTGQLVYDAAKQLPQGNSKISVDKHLAPGVYTLKASSEHRSVMRKIMVL